MLYSQLVIWLVKEKSPTFYQENNLFCFILHKLSSLCSLKPEQKTYFNFSGKQLRIFHLHFYITLGLLSVSCDHVVQICMLVTLLSLCFEFTFQ